MTKHALSTRLWHWVNAIAIIVLFMTGLNISNAHRHLYWGHYGFDANDAWLHVIRFPGWATIPGHYNLAVARENGFRVGKEARRGNKNRTVRGNSLIVGERHEVIRNDMISLNEWHRRAP